METASATSAVFSIGGRRRSHQLGVSRAYFEIFDSNQILRIGSIAECRRDVESGGYVCGAIELVIGVDGEGGRMVG